MAIMRLLFALCGLSVIVSATSGEFTSPEHLDEVLFPILAQCEIHVMSHRCVGNDTLFIPFIETKINQELEEAALKKFSARGLPYRYTILPGNLSFEEMQKQIQHEENGKGRSCQTAAWFLKPFREQGRLWIDIQFSWLTNYYSSADFVLLVYLEDPQEPQHIANLDYYSGMQPENLLLINLKSVSLGVKYVGVVLRHCNQYGTDFVQWLKKPFISSSVNEGADQNRYFCTFAPRSAHSMCLIHNFNRMPISMPLRNKILSFRNLLKLAQSVRLREILIGVEPKFHHNDFAQKFSKFILLAPYEYRQFVTAVELYEKQMNLSIQQFRSSEQYLHGFAFAERSSYFDRVSSTDDVYVTGNRQLEIMCVSRLASQMDPTSIFNPLDKWTWVCCLCSYLFLVGMLFRRSQSPFFILLAPVFTQDSELHVRKFSYLVLIWTFTCLLMTNLYSSFIGSFLVAPLPDQYVNNLQELYNNDYKLFIGKKPGQSEIKAKHDNILLLTRDADYNSSYGREKYKYLLKLHENASVLLFYIDRLNSAVGHGKSCIVEEIPFENFKDLVANAFYGYGGVQLKEDLGHNKENWLYRGTYRTVLRKGLSLFFAAGLLNVYDSGLEFGLLYGRKMVLELYMRRSNPYYTEGVFYHIGNEESLYIFTLKNEQGRLVFYVWASLVALTFVPFLLANKERIWRVFRKCTKRVQDCLKKHWH